uniref:Uncharacterized protein n=1 Tax=Arundo donax TaxID=35708 RepID=A0A0A9CG66_ARUDO
MKTELPSRLLLDRGLSSRICCLFFLLALYFEKINHLSGREAAREGRIRSRRRTGRTAVKWRGGGRRPRIWLDSGGVEDEGLCDLGWAGQPRSSIE